MFYLVEKLLNFLKLTFRPEEHHHRASLRDFQSKMSELIKSQAMLKPAENGSEMVMPAAWFDNCFEMVHATKRAFSELVAEIEYPMSQWGAAAMDEYLNYSLSLLDLLNSITSSVSHLKLLKISLLHDVNLLENSRNPAPNDVGGDFEVDRSPGIELRPGSGKKELVILEALMELKEVVVSTLSLVVSGLSAAAISAGKCDEAAGEMREKLEVVENAILGIKKQAKDLFSEEVTTRNELMNNVRSRCVSILLL